MKDKNIEYQVKRFKESPNDLTIALSVVNTLRFSFGMTYKESYEALGVDRQDFEILMQDLEEHEAKNLH